MPTFRADWFSHNIPHWNTIFTACGWDATEPKTVVEVGSYEGRSTLWILEHLLQHPDSVLHCIDIFEEYDYPEPADVDDLFERFSKNLAEAPGGRKARVHRDRSQSALARLLARAVRADFVYIDGSHQAPDVLCDLVLSFQLLRPGGILICDDYLWSKEPPGSEDVLSSPKLAIDAFANIYRRKLNFVPSLRAWQLAFVKTKD